MRRRFSTRERNTSAPVSYSYTLEWKAILYLLDFSSVGLNGARLTRRHVSVFISNILVIKHFVYEIKYKAKCKTLFSRPRSSKETYSEKYRCLDCYLEDTPRPRKTN